MSAAAGDERGRLLRALALSRRFHLFLAYCASPRAADQLVRMLGEELPRLRKKPVELVRLDPYEGRESDAPLDDTELADRILIPLLSPTEERRAHGVVHVVDASRATPADTEAWGRLFALWNEKRNALQQLGGEVLVVLPESLKRLFATAAPDVWSIRSGEYAIEEETSGLEARTMLGSPLAERREALGWYRALSPLALFGGDLLVRPWMRDIVLGADVEGLSAEPAFRGGHNLDEGVGVQRELRSAEHALGQRRFGEAGSMFQQLLENTHAYPSAEHYLRAQTGLLVALAAEDRTKEALDSYGSTSVSAILPRTWRVRLLQANAYVHWCAGRLGVAETIDRQRTQIPKGLEDQQSRLLRCVELAPAKEGDAILGADDDFSVEGLNSALIRADFNFLTGKLRTSASLLEYPFSVGTEPGSPDENASVNRAEVLTALVELARGNRSRSLILLSVQSHETGRTREPETLARVSAFYAFTSGLIHADGQKLKAAVMWFTNARAHIARWSRTGLDRRSVHRASLAVDLAHATLDPAPTDPVVVARQLVERAIALLGPTAEDFIARVLAVEARRELARRLTDSNHAEAAAEAHRALDLARPLAGRGVPAWDAILAATERDASFASPPAA